MRSTDQSEASARFFFFRLSLSSSDLLKLSLLLSLSRLGLFSIVTFCSHFSVAFCLSLSPLLFFVFPSLALSFSAIFLCDLSLALSLSLSLSLSLPFSVSVSALPTLTGGRIVREYHRIGVEQRAALRTVEKKRSAQQQQQTTGHRGCSWRKLTRNQRELSATCLHVYVCVCVCARSVCVCVCVCGNLCIVILS